MNISGVANAATAGHVYQTGTQNPAYLFSQAMAQARSAQTAKTSATSDAAKRAADVRDGLDAETLMYLDKYAEIYNKYAAQYGDGFEIVRTQFSDGSVCDAEEAKRVEARGAFIDELYEAGIPGYGRRVTVEDAQSGMLNFEPISLDSLKSKYNNEISSLFYAEKYALAGLTKDEQCQAILGSLKISTAEEMFAAAQKLYYIGAISAYDLQAIQRRTSMYASQSVGLGASRAELIAAQRDTKHDWSGILEMLEDDESSQDIFDLLSNVWKVKDDAEDEKLKAIFKKVDEYQEAIHESIERSIEKRRELELLDRAAAESARLRIMFGLDSGLGVDAADMVQDTTEALMSVL